MAPVHTAANYKTWMQAKNRIQVKGGLLEVSTSKCLWITAQACISIKPKSPPSVLIPDLSHLAFLPAELFHVQSGQTSVFMQSHTEMVGLLPDLGRRRLSWTQILGSFSILFLFLLSNPRSYFSPQTWFLSCVFLPVIICVAENWDQRWIEEAAAWQTAVSLSCTHMVQMAPCWTTLSATSILPRFKWHLLNEYPHHSFCFTLPSQAHSISAATQRFYKSFFLVKI